VASSWKAGFPYGEDNLGWSGWEEFGDLAANENKQICDHPAPPDLQIGLPEFCSHDFNAQ
jgi:hypothetical protein